MNKEEEEQEYSHKIALGKISYSEKGILISTRFNRSKLLIDWNEISFLSLTPALKKSSVNTTYDDKNIEDSTFIEVRVALKNRIKLLERADFWCKILLLSILFLSPFHDADDKPTKLRGTFHYQIKKKSIKFKIVDLISYWKKFTKFDLIVTT